jgi:phage shock protein A
VSLTQTYTVAHDNAEKMRQMTVKLQQDIETLETRKDAIKAKVSVAKAQQTVNKTISGTKKSEASISAFERMEAKADRMLDEAQAEAELTIDANSSKSLLDKYSTGTGSASVEAELAQLKAMVAGGQAEQQ